MWFNSDTTMKLRYSRRKKQTIGFSCSFHAAWFVQQGFRSLCYLLFVLLLLGAWWEPDATRSIFIKWYGYWFSSRIIIIINAFYFASCDCNYRFQRYLHVVIFDRIKLHQGCSQWLPSIFIVLSLAKYQHQQATMPNKIQASCIHGQALWLIWWSISPAFELAVKRSGDLLAL